MDPDVARQLNSALSAIDAAKTQLAIECQSGSDESISAAGDQYEAARQQMADAMKAVAEQSS